MRDVESVLRKAQELPGDLFVIGGEQVYRSFLPHIEKWLVTEVPLTIEDPDAFVPTNYLEGFILTDAKKIGEDLTVSIYTRAMV
jgi:dihydrofolate reductase